MQKNKIGYLGLLGFLGFLGLVTGNEGFYGFFGFFGFLSAFWGRGTDERVDKNINKACRNSFIFSTLASVFFILYITILKAITAFPMVFSVLFAGNMIIFVASFIYYNERGDEVNRYGYKNKRT
jgi:hypothetical protein